MPRRSTQARRSTTSLVSDLAGYANDLSALFENVARHSHERTRVIVQSYSQAWRPILRLAETLRLRPRKPVRNWISPEDARNMLDLAGFEILTCEQADPLPEACPPALDLPERDRCVDLAVQRALPDVVDHREGRASPQSTSSP